ncbi:MAG: arsenate reductase ArsC [Candidatus Omnitrophica bacterium]|nr:arsenate reductase ArsC [Candidatus Omnitrophota bacterium]
MNKKKVLFVCVENACRSQMAEGFARFFGAHVLDIYSAGSNPAKEVNPEAIRVMQEVNIDISNQKPKGFNELDNKEFDYVITLGCHDVCPFVPARKHIEWDIEDPKGKSTYFFRQVREKIREKVLKFIKSVITEDIENADSKNQ